MNSNSLIILILIAIMAFFTNPSKEKHKAMIIEKTQEKAAKDLGILGEISNKTGLTRVLIQDSDILNKDYYLMSMTHDTDGQLITIGIFTKTFYINKN